MSLSILKNWDPHILQFPVDYFCHYSMTLQSLIATAALALSDPGIVLLLRVYEFRDVGDHIFADMALNAVFF